MMKKCLAGLALLAFAGFAHDLASLTPAQVIVTGIIAAALFVGTLVLLVKWVTA